MSPPAWCRLALFLLLGLPLAAAGELLPAPERLAQHSHAWIGPYGPPTRENRGFRMNLGFVVGDDAVAVVDSGYGEPMAAAMLAEIRRVTDRPVRYVISTNSQPHRILGGALFREHGAQLVAADGAVERIVGEGPAMAEFATGVLGLAPGAIRPPGAPDRVVSAEEQLDLGGVTLRLVPVGTAHTPGSLLVEVVEDRVVFAGDVLYGGRLLSLLPVSRVDGWIEAFDRLRAFDGVLFVPGHGRPDRLAPFEQSTHAYLVALKRHMDAAAEAGTGLQQAIDSLDQSAWQALADFDLLAGRNASIAYLEREAAAFE